MAGAGDIPVGAGSATEAIDVPARQRVNIELIRRFKANPGGHRCARSEAPLRSGSPINRGGKLARYTRVGSSRGGLSLGSAPARTY